MIDSTDTARGSAAHSKDEAQPQKRHDRQYVFGTSVMGESEMRRYLVLCTRECKHIARTTVASARAHIILNGSLVFYGKLGSTNIFSIKNIYVHQFPYTKNHNLIFSIFV